MCGQTRGVSLDPWKQHTSKYVVWRTFTGRAYPKRTHQPRTMKLREALKVALASPDRLPCFAWQSIIKYPMLMLVSSTDSRRRVQKNFTKKKTIGAIGRPKAQNRTAQYYYFSFQFPQSHSSSYILMSRKCYPKTKIEKPNATHPKGPRSIYSSFKWAGAFLDRLCGKFGRSVVAQKLRRWQWDMTTCFSGIGCAEAVPSSFVVNFKHSAQKSQPFPLRTFFPTVICRLSNAWSSRPRTSSGLSKEQGCSLHVNVNDIVKKS